MARQPRERIEGIRYQGPVPGTGTGHPSWRGQIAAEGIEPKAARPIPLPRQSQHPGSPADEERRSTLQEDCRFGERSPQSAPRWTRARCTLSGPALMPDRCKSNNRLLLPSWCSSLCRCRPALSAVHVDELEACTCCCPTQHCQPPGYRTDSWARGLTIRPNPAPIRCSPQRGPHGPGFLRGNISHPWLAISVPK